MRTVLIVGVVLALCFVGTASDSIPLLKLDHPCAHSKLKALDNTVWSLSIESEQNPNTYYTRMYKCKECKAQVLIQQAIEMPEVKEVKCDKQHLESFDWAQWGTSPILIPTNE